MFKPNGKVIDAVETVAIDSNMVMARNTDGKWVIQSKPTPGFSNTVEGHAEFLASLVSNEKSDIVINEILPSNDGNFKNSNGEFVLNKSSKLDENINDETIAQYI